MGPKGRVTTLKERIEIGERWEAGETDPKLRKRWNARFGLCVNGAEGTNERVGRDWFLVWEGLLPVHWDSFHVFVRSFVK